MTHPTTRTSQPQAVLAPLTESAMFLTLTVADGAEKKVRELLGDLPGLTRSVGFRVPDEDLTAVVGIGDALWDRMFSDVARPQHLHPFPELNGAKHAPSTPGDLLLHLRARRMHPCFELAKLVTTRLGDAATVVDEVHGFRYFDARDLLGFVDGTENPVGSDAAAAVVIGPDDDRDHAGGTYVIVQKYLHDLEAWNAISTEEQEKAIGRFKLDDVEFADEDKPANAHNVLTVIEDEDGNELDILRDNMPFGSVGEAEYGTYFIGYAADPGRTERMLRNMFLGNPEGTTDRLLDFSRAVTGALFFVPSADFLDNLG